MPIYVSLTREETLSREQKKHLAERITHIHCGYTGAPKEFVQVVLQPYLDGSGFLASALNAVSLFNGSIRGGRDTKNKQNMLTEFWSLFRETTGAFEDQLAISLQDLRAGPAMEYGAFTPRLAEHT
jgi:phenylpyruvate tautomerase PptA (4-oxalocrotonate tautomerase family)